MNHRLGIGDSLLTRCGRASGQFVDSKVTDEQLLELLCVSVGIIDVYTEQTCVLTRCGAERCVCVCVCVLMDSLLFASCLSNHGTADLSPHLF